MRPLGCPRVVNGAGGVVATSVVLPVGEAFFPSFPVPDGEPCNSIRWGDLHHRA